MNPGTLGGRFTTLEGLLNQIYEELDATGFAKGDAAQAGQADGMAVFLKNLKLVSGFEGREGPEADAEPPRRS